MREFLFFSLLSGMLLIVAGCVAPDPLAALPPSQSCAFTQMGISSAQLEWSSEQNSWVAVGGGPWNVGFRSSEEAKKALALMNQAHTEQDKGNSRSATSDYNDVATRYPNSAFAPEALYQAGQLYEVRNQFSDASACYSKILQEYPRYPHFNEVVQRQFEIAEKLGKGERPYYFGVIPGLKNYDDAIKFYRVVVANDPYGKDQYAPQALMAIAELSENYGKKEDAIVALEELIEKYPGSDLAPLAYERLGDLWSLFVQGPAYDQGATQEAIKYYGDFVDFFPGDHNLARVQEKLVKMNNILAESKKEQGDFYYERRNNATAAMRAYGEAKTIAPDSEAAKQAQVQIDKIEAGVPPPGTPVDFLFGGKYQEPTVKESIYDDHVMDGISAETGIVGETTQSESIVDSAGDTLAAQQSNAQGQTPFHQIVEQASGTSIPTSGELPNTQELETTQMTPQEIENLDGLGNVPEGVRLTPQQMEKAPSSAQQPQVAAP